MIKAVIFDCFGVLTTESWQLFKSTLQADQVAEARNLMRESTYGHITFDEFILGLAELTGRPENEIRQALRSDLAKNEPLIAYIRELKARGYKIGLLSNIANNWIRDSFLTPDEQALFDDMVFSFEVGMVKPEPRVFHLACERLGVEPSETILVDDIDRYCAVAADEGLHSVLYRDFAQAKSELEALLSP